MFNACCPILQAHSQPSLLSGRTRSLSCWSSCQTNSPHSCTLGKSVQPECLHFLFYAPPPSSHSTARQESAVIHKASVAHPQLCFHQYYLIGRRLSVKQQLFETDRRRRICLWFRLSAWLRQLLDICCNTYLKPSA